MVEFLIIFPVMLMLLFGALQFALLYQAKTTLNYAVYEATRAAATNNGSRDAVNEAFARGMAPLYTHEDTVDAVHAARDKVREEVNDGEFICMERINPTDTEFSAYAVPHQDFNNIEAIPVDNLVYRDPTITAGARVSLHDATLFKLKVTYCYPLYVPFLNKVIPEWFSGADDIRVTGASQGEEFKAQDLGIGTFRQNCIDQKRLPLISHAVMRMQSPVLNDPNYSTATQCR
jgi:hypothetical protein